MVFTPKIFSLPDNDWPQLRRVLARLFRCFKGRDVTNTTIFSLPDNDWPMLKQILQRLFKLCRARIETRSIIFSLPDNDWPQLRQILTRLFDCCGTEIGCDSCDLDVVSYSLTFHDLVDCGAAPIAAILNGNTFTTDNSAMNDAGVVESVGRFDNLCSLQLLRKLPSISSRWSRLWDDKPRRPLLLFVSFFGKAIRSYACSNE